MNNTDISESLAETVRDAAARKIRLAICGSGSKRFYAGPIGGAPLDVTGHRGIVYYESTELVLTARAGTPLIDIETTLAEKGQMLGFEPPYFGDRATLGGAIACGFSGPRRPYAGAARDFVLGTRIINGKGEILKFGGQVMKNVAGYDVSRLMVGALGTLGVLLDVSLKVLPKPAKEITLCFMLPADKAIETMNNWAGRPLPLSAACHVDDVLYVRLSGTESGVRAAQIKLGGEVYDNGEDFWRDLREHRHSFFNAPVTLWRLSVPPASAPINLPGRWLTDWGGAQRWFMTDVLPKSIHAAAARVEGHATPFRDGAIVPATAPLSAGIAGLQQRLMQAFDPVGILNAGPRGVALGA